MKKALVTGAAGFIGSHVVAQLLEKNVDVRAFDKPRENTVNIKGLDIEILEGGIQLSLRRQHQNTKRTGVKIPSGGGLH